MHVTQTFAALAVVSCGVASPAQIGPGQVAPEIKIEQLLNSPIAFASLAEVKGSALMIEFWATWCGPCRAQLPHLNELHAKFAERGLVVLGVSNEPEAKVKPFLEQNGMKYPIAIDTTGAATKAYGVKGIPHAFLIDKDGNVAWSGHPATIREADIEAALVGALPLGKLTDQLEPVQTLLDQGRRGRALATLLAMQQSGKLTGKAPEAAAKVIARLQREARSLFELAVQQSAAGRLFDAACSLQTIAVQFDGCEHGSAAVAQLDELASNDAGKTAVALAARAQKARQFAAGKNYDAAYAEYQALAVGGDASAEALAKKAMAGIDQKGMRGFHADCPACCERGAACAEHKLKQ